MYLHLTASVVTRGLAATVLALSSLSTAQAGTVVATNDALLQRGKYVVEVIAACGSCHHPRDEKGLPIRERGLSGGVRVQTPGYTVYMANITPDAATGIGLWTDEQLARAIREGVRPDGSIISVMPIASYRGIADADLQAIVAYLRAQPPVANALPRAEYRINPPKPYGPPIDAPVRAPSRDDPVKYGAYLAGSLGHCTVCHSPRHPDGRVDEARLGAGGVRYPGPWGVAVSRNLTPHQTGLQGWSDAEIAHAIREGVSRDGSALKPPMPYSSYRQMEDTDMFAIIAYLRTLPAHSFAGAVPAAQ